MADNKTTSTTPETQTFDEVNKDRDAEKSIRDAGEPQAASAVEPDLSKDFETFKYSLRKLAKDYIHKTPFLDNFLEKVSQQFVDPDETKVCEMLTPAEQEILNMVRSLNIGDNPLTDIQKAKLQKCLTAILCPESKDL